MRPRTKFLAFFVQSRHHNSRGARLGRRISKIEVVGAVRAGKVFYLLYLWAVVLAGVYLLAVVFPRVNLDYSLELGVLILAVMLAHWLVVVFPRGQVTSSFAAIFGAYLLFGLGAAVWVGFLGILFGQGIVNRGRPVRAVLFDSTQSVLSLYGAHTAYVWAGGALPGEEGILLLTNAPYLLLFPTVFFLASHLLNFFYVLPQQRLTFAGIRDLLLWDASAYLFLIPLGILVALVYQGGSLVSVGLILFIGLLAQVFLRRYVQLAFESRESKVLGSIARLINTSYDFRELLGIILHTIKQNIPADATLVYLWSDERQLLETVVVDNAYADQFPAEIGKESQSILVQTALAKQPVLFNDLQEESGAFAESVIPDTLRAALVVPLLQGENVLGVLLVAAKNPEVYGEHDLRLLTLIGGHISVIADNARLSGRLARFTERDPLTRLNHRYYFYQQLKCQLAQASNRELPVAVLLVGIENLSAVNEAFGFFSGDEALIRVGEIVKQEAFDLDLTARYSGKRFVMAYPGMGEIRAREKAAKIKQRISGITVGIEGKAGEIYLQVSVGLGVMPLDGTRVDELLLAAEERKF